MMILSQAQTNIATTKSIKVILNLHNDIMGNEIATISFLFIGSGQCMFDRPTNYLGSFLLV